MPIPNFVNKINFLREPGTSVTVMPSDHILMYLEKYIIAPAEEKCNYGIYSKACEIPIFFVSEKTINQKRLSIARGVFGDLRKLLDFVDNDQFGELWEKEFGDLRRLLGFVDDERFWKLRDNELGDFRKFLDFVDDERFWKLWENELNTTECLSGRGDNKEILEERRARFLEERAFLERREYKELLEERRARFPDERPFSGRGDNKEILEERRARFPDERPFLERGEYKELLEERRARFSDEQPFSGRKDKKETLEEFLVKWADPIGLYHPKGVFQDQGPEIWVSYEKICNQHRNSQNSDYTTALTLVHELGHAIMDAPTSGLDCLKTWVEEPLANMIALYYLDSVGPSQSNKYARIDYIKDFVRNQSENYALGLNLFLSNRVFDWKAWKNAKWLLCFKNDALVHWVKYIKQNWANVDDRCLEDLFREIVRQPIEFDQTLLQQAEKLYEK